MYLFIRQLLDIQKGSDELDIKLQEEITNINKGVLIYDVVIFIGLLLTSTLSGSMVLGLILGTLVALMNLTSLARTIEKSVDMTPSRAKIYTSSKYSVRMMIIALVLFVTVKSSKLHLIGVFLGLIGPKIVILTRNMLFNKIKRKEL